MTKKVLKENDIEDAENIDELFEEDEEVPAVGVSTFLKDEEKKKESKKEEPKQKEPKNKNIKDIVSEIESLRQSIGDGLNIHKIWMKLGDIKEDLEKLL